MSDAARLQRLTGILYALACVMFAGTIAELLAAKHFEEPVQLVPFALCGLGLASMLLAWKRPTPASRSALRVLMVVLIGGSLLGVWKHIEGNMGFIREMHPEVSGWALLSGALTGRAPLLASGALAVSGTIAVAASFAAGWQPRGAMADQRQLAGASSRGRLPASAR